MGTMAFLAFLTGWLLGMLVGAYLGLKLAVQHTICQAKAAGYTTQEIQAAVNKLRWAGRVNGRLY